MIVAIDGPAGAGKSTVARALAERLGFAHLDTGAMYRALTLTALREGVPTSDGAALGGLCDTHELELRPADGGLRVICDGEDVTDAIRGSEVTASVSEVAAHAEVRRAMVARQRDVLSRGDWVADGRDVGSVVSPDAEVKVFLTARPDERARRRHAELSAAGARLAPDEVLADVERRDRVDSERAESPLRAADDAVMIDSSPLSVDEVVERIVGLVNGYGGPSA